MHYTNALLCNGLLPSTASMLFKQQPEVSMCVNVLKGYSIDKHVWHEFVFLLLVYAVIIKRSLYMMHFDPTGVKTACMFICVLWLFY